MDGRMGLTCSSVDHAPRAVSLVGDDGAIVTFVLMS